MWTSVTCKAHITSIIVLFQSSIQFPCNTFVVGLHSSISCMLCIRMTFGFLTYLCHKDRRKNSGILVVVDKSAWLLIQDKKSTRLNSIASSPKQLLAAIMFNKTRLNWCEFIGYNLDSRSFSTKKINIASLLTLTIYLHLTSYP